VEATHRAAVIIPTHNRLEFLKKILDVLLAQTIGAEIFVMDDASADETKTAIPRDYPQVRYFREETARGPTFQRNKAAAMTEAEFLFTIDDDCVPTSKSMLEQAIALFDHPRVAAVTLPFTNVLEPGVVHSSAPEGGIFATYGYYGGMVALRRDVFMSTGRYREIYFIQVEEPDLMIRMLARGYVVRLGSTPPMEHHESAYRDNPKRDRQGPRNFVLFAFFNTPWPDLPLHLAGTIAVCIRRGFSNGHPIRAMHGLLKGFPTAFRERKERAPVPRDIYLLSRILKKRGEIPLELLEPYLPPLKQA
jgi:glycosyltransferase involved in cell wall biosynthesis